jgi:hypothetical protein
VSVLNESELKIRRDAVAKALKFINMRLKDNGTFSRQDLFGKDSPGRSDYLQWSRLVTRFMADEGKIERANTRGVPVYQAMEEVEVSQESVTRYMRREAKPAEPEDDLLSIARGESAKALTNGAQAKPDVVVVLEEDEATTSVVKVEPTPTQSAPIVTSEAVEPTLHEMLKALVDILPDIVTAIHRIEKKAVGLEKGMAAISKDFTDLLALVEEKK